MRVNKTTQYAVDLFQFLTTQPKDTATLSQELGCPQQFLSQIVRKLARAGIVQVQKGPTGGFYVTQDFNDRAVTVYDIFKAVEQPKGTTTETAQWIQDTILGSLTSLKVEVGKGIVPIVKERADSTGTTTFFTTDEDGDNSSTVA